MTELVDLKYFYFLMYYVCMSFFILSSRPGEPPLARILKNKNKDMTAHQKSVRKSQCQV